MQLTVTAINLVPDPLPNRARIGVSLAGPAQQLLVAYRPNLARDRARVEGDEMT